MLFADGRVSRVERDETNRTCMVPRRGAAAARVRFTFAKVPDVPLRVMEYRADRIMAASTGRVQLRP